MLTNPNTSLFQHYDMVVSFTQKLINDQLMHLTRMGIIHSRMVLVQTINSQGNFEYKFYTQLSDVPAKVLANAAYVDAEVYPSIHIPVRGNGNDVVFKLNLVSGTAQFWERRESKKFQIDNWTYGFSIDLALAELDAGKVKVPQAVQQQLKKVPQNMFTINHLFMDLDSADFRVFDPNHTSFGKSGDLGLQSFMDFMTFYQKWLKKTGNPYILGYSINSQPDTTYPPGTKVPKTLDPVGVTFTMYGDSHNPKLSNLNFLLATRGGKGKIVTNTEILKHNWFSEADTVSAKWIVADRNLTEHFFLKPTYKAVRAGFWKKLKKSFSLLNAGNSFEEAAMKGGGGQWEGFQLADMSDQAGDYIEKYFHQIPMRFDNSEAGKVAIHFQGNVGVFKLKSKDVGVCTAKGWGEANVVWKFTITLELTKTEEGIPIIKVTQKYSIDQNESKMHEGKNGCAKVVDAILDFLRFIMPELNFLISSKFIDHLFGVKIPEIEEIGDCFSKIGQSFPAKILLPDGEVFFYKNPQIDFDGNFYLGLTYKSED